MNILITGASGFIGQNLVAFFQRKGISIIALTRDKHKFNDKTLKVINSLEDISDDHKIDVIINLAGASIDKRWSFSYKQTLLNSRINITNGLYILIKRLQEKPKTFINASAVGYYGNQEDNIIEESSKPNHGFPHELCKLWEQEALKATTLGGRVFILRLGVVLGKNSGMLKRVLPIFKIGFGGKIGSGSQYMSWVHIHDVLMAIWFLITSNNSTKIYNLTSSFPITNSEWTAELSSSLNRPAFFPISKTIVNLLFGEMGRDILLNGQRVIPKSLIEEGFKFKYDRINKALEEIVN